MNVPSSTPGRQRGKMNKDLLLFVIFVAFVVVSVGGMMALNYYGEKVMGDGSKVHNAADNN